ncbi:hypothetical protein DRP53_06160 [candidate division WOR-3 bacterium]|uniref:RNase III domain-containing protein n=1 Tax=candidate division WOR-3 bacterium TaxID=2052148 RepID=A0A660SGY5_UNCW3|nr:MAG: hypothetical protein DRP53_06160 [candidate division WOR-3 bacterium]
MSYIDQAFRHPSFTHEKGWDRSRSNELLEYLGDAVYELIVRKLILERYPTEDEGWQTERKNRYTNQKFQAKLARRFNLGKRLKLGRGEERTGGKEKDSILAQTLEALIGAVFLEYGYDYAERLLRRMLDGYI